MYRWPHALTGADKEKEAHLTYRSIRDARPPLFTKPGAQQLAWANVRAISSASLEDRSKYNVTMTSKASVAVK